MAGARLPSAPAAPFRPSCPPGRRAAAAQGTPPRAGIPRIIFSRASLANGIIPHSGETSMELYHNHPHLEKEEIVQPEDIRLQTRLTMRNHKEILDWLGLDWKNVVKVTRFQKRLDESKQIEEVMADYFRDTWPPMSVYEIDGLSSPQARLEIEMWVVPDSAAVSRSGRTPAPVKGLCLGPAAARGRRSNGIRAGILVSKDMDLVFMSALTAYPFNVDPWNPGEFKLPTDAGGARQDGHRESRAHHPGRRHHVAAPDLPRELHRAWWRRRELPGAKQGDWRSCSTSLRVTDTGVPGRQRPVPDDRCRAAACAGGQRSGSRSRTAPRRARDVARARHQGQQRRRPGLLLGHHRVSDRRRSVESRAASRCRRTRPLRRSCWWTTSSGC